MTKEIRIKSVIQTIQSVKSLSVVYEQSIGWDISQVIKICGTRITEQVSFYRAAWNADAV